jgi:hypothetical protein
VFERFVEDGRQVVVLAQEEARNLRHSYIGTEHILLGVLREERSEAARVLDSFGIGIDSVRSQIARIVGAGEEASPGQIPFTPRAKKVLELALREAQALGHHSIGPEHILLGLLGEDEGVGARVLLDLGAEPQSVRTATIERLRAGGARYEQGRRTVTAASTSSRQLIDAAWLDGLAWVLETLAREIRRELGREPDMGDLLLVLACAQGTVAGAALAELPLDLDALWGTTERIRTARAARRGELERRAEEVRRAKEEAIENQEFSRAAELRDQQRQLTFQLRGEGSVPPEVLAEIRRRLGIPEPPGRSAA